MMFYVCKKIQNNMYFCFQLQATAKYHEMLNSVREFMSLNQVPRTLCERVLDYVVSKWANTKGVDQVSTIHLCIDNTGNTAFLKKNPFKLPKCLDI